MELKSFKIPQIIFWGFELIFDLMLELMILSKFNKFSACMSYNIILCKHYSMLDYRNVIEFLVFINNLLNLFVVEFDFL